MKFRKKPVIVEAEQWSNVIKDILSGNYYLDVGYFRDPEISGENICKHCNIKMHEHGWIDNLEGGHIVCPGDWIITGVNGEKYPCKPDIFEKTYEKVKE